jgi:uncharacterized protein (TIGR03118 family)
MKAATMKNLILSAIFILAPCILPAANQYVQHNLVADQAGVADFTDPNLVNAWGICTSATSPFWISDNGTGLSTLYTSIGTPNATTKPTIPATSTTVAGGNPTGCVYNGTTTAFFVPNTTTGKTANFLFATENGSLSGWSSGVNAAQAIVMVDNSKTGAVYKGLAIGTPTGGTPRIYATNFNAGTVEIYDQTWAPVTISGAFKDPLIPAGFAPFNIQNLGGKLYVTYAKQDAQKMDDVPGAGNGYVDVYDLNGSLLTALIAGGKLNSPWGLAIAPAGFGDYANDLLVGNFGDGTINVYNPTSGALISTLNNQTGAALHITGLWAIQGGNGGNGGDVNGLYFTAGPGGEAHGLLGVLQAAPSISGEGAVVHAASYTATIAPGGFVTVVGTNLAPTTRMWTTTDFVNGKLPTNLNGVSATVDGKAAYIYYISPNQINLIAPADTTQGPVLVTISNNGLAGPATTATLATYAPGFFITKNNYIAALHANGTIVGPTTLFPNNSTPTKAGETIELYATGLGPTVSVVDGLVLTTPTNTTTTPTVTVNGVAATVTSSVLTSAGLNQVNITVPAGTPNGDQAVVLTIGGVKSQATALINVQN